MRKIAIITESDVGYSGDDHYDCTTIVKSITDWKEVDQKTFDLLVSASRFNNFKVIEQPTDVDVFILNTIDDYLNMLVKQKEADDNRRKQEENRKAEAAEKRRQKQLLKLAKDEASEKELLATLLKKHPDVAGK